MVNSLGILSCQITFKTNFYHRGPAAFVSSARNDQVSRPHGVTGRMSVEDTPKFPLSLLFSLAKGIFELWKCSSGRFSDFRLVALDWLRSTS